MTFEYRDTDGCRLHVAHLDASTYYGNEPVVALMTEHRDGDDLPVVYVPLDRVEEVVAGIRDAARQAAGQTVCVHPEGYESECPCTTGCGCCKVEPAPAAENRVTVYGIGINEWDEMQSALRRIETAVGQPAEAQPAEEAHPPREGWRIELWDGEAWLPSGLVRPDRDLVAQYLAGRRKQRPDATFRLVRETTTWTVEEDPR